MTQQRESHGASQDIRDHTRSGVMECLVEKCGERGEHDCGRSRHGKIERKGVKVADLKYTGAVNSCVWSCPAPDQSILTCLHNILSF